MPVAPIDGPNGMRSTAGPPLGPMDGTFGGKGYLNLKASSRSRWGDLREGVRAVTASEGPLGAPEDRSGSGIDHPAAEREDIYVVGALTPPHRSRSMERETVREVAIVIGACAAVVVFVIAMLYFFAGGAL